LLKYQIKEGAVDDEEKMDAKSSCPLQRGCLRVLIENKKPSLLWGLLIVRG
jgi:hypothetical protein